MIAKKNLYIISVTRYEQTHKPTVVNGGLMGPSPPPAPCGFVLYILVLSILVLYILVFH